MTKQMNNITNTLIEIFLIVMWWTCLWSLWNLIMVLLMLMIIHIMVTILSDFFHLHIPFKQSLLLMSIYLFRWNCMWRNSFFTQYQFSLLCFTTNKSNNMSVSLRTIINGNVNVICYYLKYAVPPFLRSISQDYYSTLSPLQVPME